jgi:hypothetical protein
MPSIEPGSTADPRSNLAVKKRVAAGYAILFLSITQAIAVSWDLVSVLRDPEPVRKQQQAAEEMVTKMMGVPAAKPPFDPIHLLIGMQALTLFLLLVQGFSGWTIVRGKMYVLSIIGCCLTLTTCYFPCCLIALPVGLMSFVMLLQADVRASFQTTVSG